MTTVAEDRYLDMQIKLDMMQSELQAYHDLATKLRAENHKLRAFITEVSNNAFAHAYQVQSDVERITANIAEETQNGCRKILSEST